MSDDSKALVPANEVIAQFVTHCRGKLKWKLETLPEEILATSAEDLEKDQKITATDKKLRLQIHSEFTEAFNGSETVQIAKICNGICHPNHFLRLIEDPKKLGWLMLPYQNEQVRISHQVIQAQDTIEELLRLDIKNPDGSLNLKAAELKYKVAKLIYDRKYPATQVNKYINGKEPDDKVQEDITKQIEDLKKALGK